MNHIPERTCICCRGKFPKEKLIRIVKIDNQIFIDKSGKSNGRGAYFCGNKSCVAKLKKAHGLDRAFKMKVNEDFYDLLIDFCNTINSET